MKLFISYSRDDKAWVYELWRALRDEANHDTWIDRRLVPAQDWWNTILDNIEAYECFLYVMTPKSVESIYCQAELGYALALNKPVLPIMLKPCGYPSELSTRNMHYLTISDDMSLDRILLKVEQGLTDVQIKQMQGKYPTRTAARPKVPTPGKKPEQLSEVFILAEEAATENDLSRAEMLFQQVIDADPHRWGQAAAKRLSRIRFERDRDQDYEDLIQKMGGTAAVFGKKVQAAISLFRAKYGVNYDPQGVLAEPAPPAPTRLTSVDILTPPFEWIDIPAGKVTLIQDNVQDNKDRQYCYLKKDTSFDLSAFSIGKYLVTNGQFAKFIEANGYTQDQWWTEAGIAARQENSWTEPLFWQDEIWNQPDYPVVGVCWYEAMAFCRWLSELTGEQITLPTDQQWQRAAQGNDGRTYPWGRDFDLTKCNTKESGIKQTTRVDRYPQGHSPFGVFDMAGNVWEWCLTAYISGSEEIRSDTVRVLRGGAWSYLQDKTRTTYRDYNNSTGRYNDLGFRVVAVGIHPISLVN